MNKNDCKNKNGITLIVLIITIIVAIILAVAVVITLDDGIKNSRVNAFIYEILTVEDSVESYFTMNNEFPFKGETFDKFSKDELITGYYSDYKDSVEQEIEKNNDLNSTFFLVDLRKLDKSENEIQGEEDSKKEFICAYPSFNIYSVKGISVNGKRYFSITEELDDLIQKSNDGNVNANITKLKIDKVPKLTVTHDTSTWTNKLGITVKIANFNSDDELVISSIDGESSSEIINTNAIGEYKIDQIDDLKENTKKLAFSLKREGKEIAREEVDISNYDNIKPELDNIEIDDTSYQNMKTLKINDVSDGGSGLKELRYELVTEDNVQEVTNSTEDYLKRKGKYVDISNINNNANNAIVKIPKKDYLGIYVMAVDNAGNTNIKLVSQDVSCMITASEKSPTTAQTIRYTISFSEAVNGFEQSDIEIENGTISSFTGSGKDYTVVVNSLEGKKSWQKLIVPANVCTGSSAVNAGKGNIGSSLSILVDREIKPQSIMLNKSILDIAERSSETLVATVLPSDAVNKAVNWESSDPTVATVDASGNVTAIKGGNTVITASCSSDPTIKANCYVSVIPVIAKIGEKYYTNLQTAFDDCSTDSNTYTTVEILRSFTSDSVVELKSGKYAILDLNGYTITTSDNLTGNFLTNSGNLILKTSATGGKIESNTVMYIINNKNNLEINDATIKHNKSKYCIYVNSSSSCTLNSGKLQTSNVAVNISSSPTAKFIQNKGEITSSVLNYGNYEFNGGTIDTIANARNFEMKSGSINGNLSQATLDEATSKITGGSIAKINISKGIITLGEDDGTVSTTSPQVTTSGVNISDTGKFNFYDGMIKGEGSAITGNVASKPSRHVIQKTKDSSTNIETAILVPGNSVEDIAYVQCSVEKRMNGNTYSKVSMYSYDANNTGIYGVFYYSLQNNNAGNNRNLKAGVYFQFKFKFFDKDRNELTNIQNDLKNIKMAVIPVQNTAWKKCSLPYSQLLKESYSKDMPAKFIIAAADENKYVGGVDFRNNVDIGERTEKQFELPDNFSTVNMYMYTEMYGTTPNDSWYDKLNFNFYINGEKTESLEQLNYSSTSNTLNVSNVKTVYDSSYSKFETEFKKDTGW